MTIPYATNLKLLLDSSTVAGNDGDSVTSWADQSGQGNNAATYTGSTAPVKKTNIFGTKPAIRFGGATTDGLTGAFASFTSGAATIFIAGTMKGGSAAFGGMYSCYRSSLTNDFDNTSAMILAYGSDSQLIIASSNNVNLTCAMPANTHSSAIPSLPFVHAASANSSRFRCWLNGPPVVSGSSGFAPNFTNYVLGQRWTSSAKSTTLGGKMDLAYFAVYDAALTDTQVAGVSLWMMQQMGLPVISGLSKGRAT